MDIVGLHEERAMSLVYDMGRMEHHSHGSLADQGEPQQSVDR